MVVFLELNVYYKQTVFGIIDLDSEYMYTSYPATLLFLDDGVAGEKFGSVWETYIRKEHDEPRLVGPKMLTSFVRYWWR